MVATDIYVVTGANGGLGLACVRRLAKLPHERIYLCSRSLEKGEEARRDLPDTVVVRQLDISSQASVDALAAALEKELGEKRIKALVNNAGVLSMEKDPAQAKLDVDVNYFGTRRMMVAFRHLMKPDEGRMVNVMSRVAALDLMRDGPMKAKLLNAKSAEELDQMAREIMDKPGLLMTDWYDDTWNYESAYYAASKALGNALARVMAPHSMEHSKTALLSVCPGLVTTDMVSRMNKTEDSNPLSKVPMLSKFLTDNFKPKEPLDGASVLEWAATVDHPEKYNGRFYGEEREVSMETGLHL